MNKVKRNKNKENRFISEKNNNSSKKVKTIKEEDIESDHDYSSKKDKLGKISSILDKKNSLKIHKIKLENFKSFEGLHEIGFFLDFSAVIGPNGSGKSNIIDAICFCLGMKTVSLRTKNLKDLIYKKDYDMDDNNRSAYVELVFLVEGDEIAVKRTIPNKGPSDYYINGIKLNKEQYLMRLEELKIPSKARYFILVQGAIDTMLSKKNDLTDIIEYLSGSYIDKEKYDIINQEIESLNNDISKLSMEMHNLKDDRNRVKIQIENEEQYHEILSNLNKCLEKMYLYKLAELDLKIYSNEEKLAENEHSINIIQDEKKKLIDMIKTNELEAKKLDNLLKVVETDSDKYIEVKELKQKLDLLNENIKLSENMLFTKISMLNQYKSDKKKKDDKINVLSRQLEEYNQKSEFLRRKINADIPEGKLNRDQIVEYRNISKNFEKESFQINKEIERIENLISDNLNKKNIVEKAHSKFETEKMNLENELKETLEKLNKENLSNKTLDYETKILKKDINVKSEEKLLIENEVDKLESELSIKMNLLTQYECENSENLKRKKVTELIHRNSSVYGFLYELITPLNKKLELPIKVSLLKYLGHLVVENEDTAKICSEFLKSKEINADVLVLNNIPIKEVDESTRLRIGNMGNLVVDMIDCKKKGLKSAISYFLKDTILCYDKENIIKLKSKGFTSIITPDGTLYKKGTITGGNYKSLDQYSFNYRPNSEIEINKLKKDIELILKTLNDYNIKKLDLKEISLIKNKLIEKENLLELNCKNIKNFNESISKLKMQIEIKSNNILDNNNVIENYLNNIDDLKSQCNSFDNKYKEIKNSHFRVFLDKHKLKNVDELESYSINEIKKFSEELNILEEKIGKINSQIQVLQSGEENIIKLESSITNEKEKKKSFENEKKEIEEKYKSANECLLKENESMSGNKLRLENIMQDIKKNQNELDRIDKRIRNLLKNKTEFRHLILECIDGKNNVIEESKININNYSEVTSFMLNFKFDMDNYIISKELNHDKINIKFDYTAIESKSKVKEMSLDIISEKILNLNEKFSNYMKEIEKYVKLVSQNEKEATELKNKEEELQNKKKNIQLQVSTLVSDLDSKKLQFMKVKKQRKEKFESLFKKFVDSVIVIYKDLTKPHNSNSPGGSAFLYASNEEEPYLGTICYLPTPPGKRIIYDIDQLSGGEKTIAIISLILALQTICETPFIILDEIDSYLDPEHELILESVFQKHHKNFQIIIVTHKSNIFRSAQSLIGTYFNKVKYSSIPITLDMTKIS